MTSRRYTLHEFLAEKRNPPTYVVDGLLPDAGLSVLAGPPKTGKSTLARYVLRCVAAGVPALGRATRQATCLLYALEENPDVIADEFRRFNGGTLPVHIRTRNDWTDVIATLEADIVETDARFVIADPLIDTLSVEDLNAYGEMNERMKLLLRTCRDMNTHVMLVHHVSKGDYKRASSILGSRAIEGATDVNIMMHVLSSNKRVIESFNRIGVSLPESYVLWDAATGNVTLRERSIR